MLSIVVLFSKSFDIRPGASCVVPGAVQLGGAEYHLGWPAALGSEVRALHAQAGSWGLNIHPHGPMARSPYVSKTPKQQKHQEQLEHKEQSNYPLLPMVVAVITTRHSMSHHWYEMGAKVLRREM